MYSRLLDVGRLQCFVMEFIFYCLVISSQLLARHASQRFSKCGDCYPAATGSYSPSCQCDDYCQFFMDAMEAIGLASQSYI